MGIEHEPLKAFVDTYSTLLVDVANITKETALPSVDEEAGWWPFFEYMAGSQLFIDNLIKSAQDDEALQKLVLRMVSQLNFLLRAHMLPTEIRLPQEPFIKNAA